METIRRFAMIYGAIFAIVGIAGFIPGLLQEPAASDPALRIDTLYGRLLGLFPVNALHSVVHLALGIWGVLAAKSPRAAINYARSVAVIYGVLTLMGLIPGLNTMFGLVPLHAHDIWLHAGSALIAAYFGFARKYETEAQRTPG